jgi:hypothetical protein
MYSLERRAPDLWLLVDDRRIGVHRFVLSARSTYFRQLLDGGFAESAQRELRLANVAHDTMRCVLRFLYSGDAHAVINADNAVDLLGAADMLLLEPLKQRCERYLLDNADLELNPAKSDEKDDDNNNNDDDDDNDGAWMGMIAEQFSAPKLFLACKRALIARQLCARDRRELANSDNLLRQVEEALESTDSSVVVV